jgi:hypothetical protein
MHFLFSLLLIFVEIPRIHCDVRNRQEEEEVGPLIRSLFTQYMILLTGGVPMIHVLLLLLLLVVVLV